MGMEALETVVGYWEDALSAYQSGGKHKLLTTSEEAEFTKMLETILEAAYQLQVILLPFFLSSNIKLTWGC